MLNERAIKQRSITRVLAALRLGLRTSQRRRPGETPVLGSPGCTCWPYTSTNKDAKQVINSHMKAIVRVLFQTFPWRMHTRSAWSSSAALELRLGASAYLSAMLCCCSSEPVCVTRKFLFEGIFTLPAKLCTQWLISLFQMGLRVRRKIVSLAATAAPRASYELWALPGLITPLSSGNSKQELFEKHKLLKNPGSVVTAGTWMCGCDSSSS